MKYFALNDTVYDLGLFMQTNWLVLNTHWNINLLLQAVSNQGLRFVLFPLAIIGSYPLILAFQSIFLGSGSLAIFLLSKDKLGSIPSVLLSFSYLLYFPLAGVNWFDVHFQAFFIPMFLFGVYFHTRDRYLSSAIFLFLSAIVKLPYIIYVLLFYLLGLVTYLLRAKKGELTHRNELTLSIFMIMLLSFLLFFGVELVGSITEVTRVSLSSTPTIYYNLHNRLLTVVLIFAPFLFLPFFSKRWFLFLLPFLFILFHTDNFNYIYPLLFHLQYSSAFIPFLFLGTIDTLSALRKREKRKKRSNILKRIRFTFQRNNNITKSITLVILGIMLLSSIFYQPYGPLNNSTKLSYHLSEETKANITIFHEVNQLVNLIPKNNSYVLFQNNIPQVLPRILSYNNTPIIGDSLSYNFTFYNGQTGNETVRIDYVLADPYSHWFDYVSQISHYPSLRNMLNYLYGSGNFGILAEESGITLLERNYSGPIQRFIPYEKTIAATNFYNATTGDTAQYAKGYSPITGINASNTFFFGGITNLMPGKYNITIQLKTNNLNTSNHFTFQANYGNVDLVNQTIVPSNLDNTRFTNITFTFNLNESKLVQFRGINLRWFGRLSFFALNIRQISP